MQRKEPGLSYVQRLTERESDEIWDYIHERNLNCLPIDVLGQNRKGGYNFSMKTPREIETFLDGLDPKFIDDFFIRTEIETPLFKLIKICRRFALRDSTFQNLNTERERAKKEALVMKDELNEIVSLIPLIKDEEAEAAAEVLRMLNYPFVMVLCDQLKFLEYAPGIDVDKARETISQSKEIQHKIKRHHLKLLLSRMEMSRTYTIDPHFNKYLNDKDLNFTV